MKYFFIPSPLYAAIMENPVVQLCLTNPRILAGMGTISVTSFFYIANYNSVR